MIVILAVMIYSFSVSHKIQYKGVFFITKPDKSVFYSIHRLFVDAKNLYIYCLIN